MIGLINRGNLPDSTQQEFENFAARLREIFLTEHNEDGTHRTADRLLNVVPVGGTMQWLTDTAPTGWLLCRGQQVSRLTYKGLFDVIGVAYGSGDGSTTFNVPDLQGRFPLGKAASGTGSTLAGTGGALDHTHSGGSHSHTIGSDGSHDHGGVTGADGDHTHTYGSSTFPVIAGGPGLNVGGNTAAIQVTISGTTSSDGSHDHDINADGNHDHGGATGSASAGTTGGANPAYLTINYIVFTGVA